MPRPYPKPGAVWRGRNTLMRGRRAEVLKVWKEPDITQSEYVTRVAVRYLDNNRQDQWEYGSFMINFIPEPELCNDGLPVGADRSRGKTKPQRLTAWDHLLQDVF